MDIDFPDAPDGFTPSSDMLTWVRVAEPCEVTAVLTVHGNFPFPSNGTVPPEYMMMILPRVAQDLSLGQIAALTVEFNRERQWIAASIRNNFTGGLTIPCRKDGYTAEEAAEFALLQMELNDTSKGWSEVRRLGGAGKWSSAQARADSEGRIAALARRRVARQVRVEALEMIGRNHSEEFEEAWEAAQVARALNSDWFPESSR